MAARVEFHLVQPSELSQVREKPKDTMANVSNKEALDGTAEEGDDKSAILGVDTEAESDVEVEKIECASDVLDFHAAAENQSNMKWNRNMGIADPKDGDPQPLATFDVGNHHLSLIVSSNLHVLLIGSFCTAGAGRSRIVCTVGPQGEEDAQIQLRVPPSFSMQR